MKLKTEQEIEDAHSKIFGLRSDASDKEHWDYTLGGFRAGVRVTQQDLLDSASEGFEEYFSEFEKRSTPIAIKNIVLEIWQAATIASEKRIQEQRTINQSEALNTSLHRENQKLQEAIKFLKVINGRLEEARVAHLEDNEKLQEENKKFQKEIERLKHELSYSAQIIKDLKREAGQDIKNVLNKVFKAIEDEDKEAL